MATEKKETKKTAKKTEVKKETAKKAPIKKETTKKVTPKKVKDTAAKKTTIMQEENNYGKTLLAAVLIVLVLLGAYLGVQYKKNGGFGKDGDYVATADEKKFKKDYESLNGTTRTNGQKNKEVEIIADNNIKYISIKEAADILESGSGVIYFGFAACPWCRNSVPVLLDAMSSSELKEIYYVDIRPEDKEEKDIRDLYTLNAKNKAKKQKDAADPAYHDVLLALANYLNDYVLETDKGKKVNAGEKRLYAPTVVAVKDGIVVGFHEGTVDNHEKSDNGELRDLTNEERKELLNTYTNLISNYFKGTCDGNKEGC